MTIKAKRVLIMGGTGFVGRELGRRLVEDGHRVAILARKPDDVRDRLPFPCEVFAWLGGDAEIPGAALVGRDAVVNLVGEGIADRAWTAKRRAAIQDSRTQSVAALTRALMRAPVRPEVLVQASAVGYYGDRGEAPLTESAGPGGGFLAETCVAWERGAGAIEALGVRVARLRLAMVLGLSGGALPKLLGVYAKGLGAVLGNGQQWASWIHVEDLAAMIAAAIVDERWRGAFNASAPHPCRNAAMTAAIARHGRYSAGKSVPALGVRAALGGRAALVLGSAKALPAAALALGFGFRFADIDAACADLLGTAVDGNLRRHVVRQWIPVAPALVWPFFTEAGNLEQLTPPWLAFKVDAVSTPTIGEGTRLRYKLTLHGIPVLWESLITGWQPGVAFIDEQKRGPYAVWHHSHRFEPLAGGTLMTDDVQYRLPVAPLGELLGGPFVERDVTRIFAHRSKAVAGLLTSRWLLDPSAQA